MILLPWQFAWPFLCQSIVAHWTERCTYRAQDRPHMDLESRERTVIRGILRMKSQPLPPTMIFPSASCQRASPDRKGFERICLLPVKASRTGSVSFAAPGGMLWCNVFGSSSTWLECHLPCRRRYPPNIRSTCKSKTIVNKLRRDEY